MQRALWVAVLAWGFSGCAHSGAEEAEAGGFSDPDWVERGNALVVEDGNRRFFAVGQARDRLRIPLLKKIAEKKAVEAVGEPLKRYLTALAGPWLHSLGPKVMQEKPKPAPVIMLDKLLERCEKLAAVDDVFVTRDEKAVWALARVDFMAVLMEMQASADVEPMLSYLGGAGIDPKVVFDKVAAGELGGQAKGGEAPAEAAEGAPPAAQPDEGTPPPAQADEGAPPPAQADEGAPPAKKSKKGARRRKRSR